MQTSLDHSILKSVTTVCLSTVYSNGSEATGRVEWKCSLDPINILQFQLNINKSNKIKDNFINEHILFG